MHIILGRTFKKPSMNVHEKLLRSSLDLFQKCRKIPSRADMNSFYKQEKNIKNKFAHLKNREKSVQ